MSEDAKSDQPEMPDAPKFDLVENCLTKGSINYAKIDIMVDGEQAALFASKRAIMFELSDKRIRGVAIDSIQMISLDGDQLLLAYLDGSSVKSLRIQPVVETVAIAAIANAPKNVLEGVFMTAYENLKRKLEARLVRIAKGEKWSYTQDEWNHESCTKMSLYAILQKDFGFNPKYSDILVEEFGILPDGAKAFYARVAYIAVLMDISMQASSFWPARNGLSALRLPNEEEPIFFRNDEGMFPEDLDQWFVKEGVLERPFLSSIGLNFDCDVEYTDDASKAYILKKDEHGVVKVYDKDSYRMYLENEELTGVDRDRVLDHIQGFVSP